MKAKQSFPKLKGDEDEWFSYAMLYTSAASSILRGIHDTILIEEKYSGTVYVKQILIPTLYNFRHSIELLLKFFAFRFKLPFRTTHDLIKLKIELKTFMDKIDKKKIVSQKFTISNMKGDNPDEMLIKLTQDQYSRFIKIIDKYYGHSYFFKTGIEDPDNTLFRYPSKHYLTKMLVKIDRKTINEISSDIEFMTMFQFFFLGVIA